MQGVSKSKKVCANSPRGYGFGVDEKKIRLEITTKEGFELSKEVENFKWAEQYQ